MTDKMEADIHIWCEVCGRNEIYHIELPKKKCKGCGFDEEWRVKGVLN